MAAQHEATEIDKNDHVMRPATTLAIVLLLLVLVAATVLQLVSGRSSPVVDRTPTTVVAG